MGSLLAKTKLPLKGNLVLIKWPSDRPGLRFAVLQNSILTLNKDEWAVRGKTYKFYFCGTMESCNVICAGYPDKINYVLNIIFDRYFQLERLSLNLNIKRTNSNEDSIIETKRFKI